MNRNHYIWRGIRLILFNQIVLISALLKIHDVPEDTIKELGRRQEDIADFLEETPRDYQKGWFGWKK